VEVYDHWESRETREVVAPCHNAMADWMVEVESCHQSGVLLAIPSVILYIEAAAEVLDATDSWRGGCVNILETLVDREHSNEVKMSQTDNPNHHPCDYVLSREYQAFPTAEVVLGASSDGFDEEKVGAFEELEVLGEEEDFAETSEVVERQIPVATISTFRILDESWNSSWEALLAQGRWVVVEAADVNVKHNYY